MASKTTTALVSEARTLGEWLARTGTEYGPEWDRYQDLVAELARRGEWF